MPRNVDPGTIKVGKGLAPEGTVEDNSLRYPERDVDPLRVHLHDPSRAHMAETIGIKDEGDCYVSDEVEGALQEICGGASAGRLNGLVAGGRFDEVIAGLPTGGLTLTLESATAGNNDTIVLIGAAALDVSGLTVTVPDASVVFVYLDCDSTSPTYRTLLWSNTPPEVESAAGIEHILFAKVTTAGGVVTEYQDGRFFVRNLDRKVQYSSRQGENVDAWSEGCFVTLEAFALWAEYYGDPSAGDEEEKGTVLIRGTHTVSGTLTIPSDHLQFVGDGEAIIQGGNSAAPIIDITARDNITFRGITFSRAGAETQAVLGGDGTTNILFQDCTFTGSFPEAVRISSGAGTAANITVRGGRSSGPNKFFIVAGATTVRMDSVEVEGTGTAAINNAVMIDNSTDVSVLNSSFDNFNTAVICEGLSNQIRVTGNRSRRTSTGALFEESNAIVFSNNVVELDDTDGLVGVRLADCVDVALESNTLSCLRVAFGTPPRGFEVITTNGSTQHVRIVGNHLDGFAIETAPPPHGSDPKVFGQSIYIATIGIGGGALRDVVVQGNTCAKAGIALVGQIENWTVANNTLDGFFNQTFWSNAAGIHIFPEGDDVAFSGTVSENDVRRFGDGVLVEGTATIPVTRIKVLSNNIREVAHTQDNQVDSFFQVGTRGIGFHYANSCEAVGNAVGELGQVSDNAGIPVAIVGNLWGLGIYARNSSDFEISDNLVSRPEAHGIGTVVGIVASISNPGSPLVSRRVKVRGNKVVRTTPSPAASSAIGFFCYDTAGNTAILQNVSVVENVVEGFLRGILFSTADLTGAHLGGQFTDLEVSRNELTGYSERGILFDSTPTGASATQTSSLEQLVCSDNRLDAGAAPGDMVNISLNLSTDGFPIEVSDCAFSGNQIAGFGIGIRVRVDAPSDTANFKELQILDNRIDVADAAATNGIGVVVERPGANHATGSRGWMIRGNQLGSSTSGIPGMRSGASFDFGATPFSDFVFDDNIISCIPDAAAAPHAVSATVSNVAGASLDLNRFSFSGNMIEVNAEAGILGGVADGIICLFPDRHLSAFRFDNNTIRPLSALPVGPGVGGVGRAIWLQVSDDDADLSSVEGLSIQGNQVNGGRILVQGENANFRDCLIQSNLVNSPAFADADSSLAAPCIGIELEANALGAGTSSESLVVKDNTLFGGNYGVLCNTRGLASETGTHVIGNTARGQVEHNPSPTGLVGGYGFCWVTDDIEGRPLVVKDIRLDQNTALDWYNQGVLVIHQPNNELSELSGLSVSGNKIYGPSTHPSASSVRSAIQISLDVGNSGAGGALRDVRCDENSILPNADSAGCQNGIYFFGIQNPNVGSPTLRDWSASGNKVQLNLAGETTGIGIWLRATHEKVDAATLDSLSIDNNEVLIAGAPTNSLNGVLCEATLNLKNVSICHNKVNAPTVAPAAGGTFGGHAIRLYHAFTTVEAEQTNDSGGSLTVDTYLAGRYVASPGAVGYAEMQLRDPGGADGFFKPVVWDGLNVSHNTIKFSAGIDDPGSSDPGDPASVAIEHVNSTNSSWVSVCLWNFTFSGNVATPRKQRFIGALLPSTTTTETVGLRMANVQAFASWPGDTPLGLTDQIVQWSWVINGNNFNSHCSEVGAGTYYGRDVVVSVNGPGAGGFQYVIDSNHSAESGAGLGFDATPWSLASGTNLNVNPKRYS